MTKEISVVAAAMLLLAGCVGPNDYFIKPFEQMSPEEVSRLQSLPTLGSFSNITSFCLFVRVKNEQDMTKGANDFILSELRRRGGFTRRDIEILADPSAGIGTGMSLNGLKCSFGPSVRVINTSFNGQNHNWQVRLLDGYGYTFSFAYMEGNGTEAGMRVRSWN